MGGEILLINFGNMEGKIEKINISLVGILNVIVFLAFFFAKIFDKIDWSWWWVFSPLWMPFAIIGAICLIAGLIYLGTIIIETILSWK